MANQTQNQIANTVKSTPVMNRLKGEEMLRRAHSVHPDVRKFIARESLKSQIVRKQKSYYSTVRFPFDVQPVPTAANAPPTQWTYTLNKKKVIAFSYGISDDMTAAGFPKDFNASEAETNLISKGDTGGATVEIHGISLHLDETSDAKLAKYLWSRTFVDITLDGSTRYVLLGRMGRLASPGGLYGAGESYITPPSLGESTARVGVLTNGMPTSNNFYKLNERIRWNPSSKIDSKFQIRFECSRDISFTVGNRAAAPGVASFDPPTTAGAEGTYVDVVVYLHAHEIMPRTTQQ